MNVLEYRFSQGDEHAITSAINGVIGEWRSQQVGTWTAGTNDKHTLMRIAAHSIGCSLLDLRDTEVEYITEQVERACR